MAELEPTTRRCPDCGVETGQNHKDGCDVERCPLCGMQQLSCSCVYGGHDPSPGDGVYEDGPTKEMYTEYDAKIDAMGGRIKWTGDWPGDAECSEFGWYARFVKGKGWVRCEKDDDSAGPDLNRLVMECVWDVKLRRFVRPE